jgi:hypothetical protein
MKFRLALHLLLGRLSFLHGNLEKFVDFLFLTFVEFSRVRCDLNVTQVSLRQAVLGSLLRQLLFGFSDGIPNNRGTSTVLLS